jgi:16S rRNA (cytidine1402-2'-O)-methyltransferase
MSDDAPAEPPPPATARAALVLVSTPIGNLADLSPRARDELANADLILCEDTRHTARLLAAFNIQTRTQSLHEHNEDARIPVVRALIRAGKRVALVSDAGTPVVSDPGYRLVRAVIEAGLPVTAIPGPSAAVTALVLSGLPPQPFLFLGFPPPRQAARRAAFAQLRAAEQAGLSATLVWYEAPHRLSDTLQDLAETFGDRPAAIARELTKRFEEVRRGTPSELAGHYSGEPARGEMTIVLGRSANIDDISDLDEQLRLALEHHSLRDAAALVATATGLPRKLVYARALELVGRTG